MTDKPTFPKSKHPNNAKYWELQRYLRDKHFYAKVIHEAPNTDYPIAGLWIDCIPVLKVTRLEAVKKAITKDFEAKYVAAKQIIEITLKKKK